MQPPSPSAHATRDDVGDMWVAVEWKIDVVREMDTGACWVLRGCARFVCAALLG
jgi:hypothetical protein